MHPEWQSLLDSQRPLVDSIETALGSQPIQPARSLVMRAFEEPPSQVKVVFVGQDPYPNPLHAIGLAFAVPAGTRPLPPTLRNIIKELEQDLEATSEPNFDLAGWQQQGVMLLNRHLTTSPGKSLAHQLAGWQLFTVAVVRVLAGLNPAPIFVLWGNQAQELKAHLPANSLLIESPHPSPLSAYRGFFGSRPFSRINQLLLSRGQSAINWLHA